MTVRWALIGASNIARQFLAPAIHSQPDGEIVAVMSADAGRARAFAVDFAIPHACTDLDAVLRDDVDAVYVSTTNELHFPQALAAARAGKHVLCDKPLALSLADAAAMISACRAAGVVLATNHHLRAAGTHRAMRVAIRRGDIGRPVAARIFQADYLPAFAQGWRVHRRDKGGGVILDRSVHGVDTLRHLLGEDPAEVTAFIQSGAMASDGIEDGAMTLIRFPSGFLATLHEGFTTPHATRGIEIDGSQGCLIGEDVMTQRPVGTVRLCNEAGETELSCDREDLYVRGVRALHAAFRGEGAPLATGEDGAWSLATALAALESARTGRTVRVDPLIPPRAVGATVQVSGASA